MTTIVLDAARGGCRFDGVGAISAGGSARLLRDYPEPERGEVLDYLFAPNYGAALQILKVEIGGDTNSTAGAEPSHMRMPGDLGCDRGYEWWLATEAKRRNPNVRLAALQWGAPGWFTGGFWSRDNVAYLRSWLDCAARHDLEIDYLGGWNERGFDARWYRTLRRELAESHPHVRIVAADEYESWSVATAMRKDARFSEAVDIISSHDPGGARSGYRRCPSSADALALGPAEGKPGKPLWNSETSAQAHDVGAGPIARSINRDYLDGRMTGHLYWSIVSGWYASLPIPDTGLVLADTPWSGHYELGPGIWSLAHTAQFTAPGWRYLDSGCGYLPGGASYVTLRAPEAGDYTVVVETIDATDPEAVTFALGDGLSAAPVHIWSTDLTSLQEANHFVLVGQRSPDGGAYSVTFEPGHVYTLSTTTGQQKGTARSRGTRGARLGLPFRERFDGYHAGELARYFSDLNGAFQVEPCGRGRSGMCYAQVVETEPIGWNRAGQLPPTTLVGDPRWWGDYEVAADVLLEHRGAVELLGRVDAQRGRVVSGYHLTLAGDGRWRLYREGFHAPGATLASGRAEIAPGSWHRLGLRFLAAEIAALVDGHPLGYARDEQHNTGQVGLRVPGFRRALFDDLAVSPTGPEPTGLPIAGVTASSARTANYRGYTYPPSRAMDGRPETFWHSDFPHGPGLPQSITADLGRLRDVGGLTYRPRTDGDASGVITGYAVQTSTDGETYGEVARGEWPVSHATKIVRFDPHRARWVRLVAVAGVRNLACAAELGVLPAAETAR
jgi:hypothetical protein